jgi:hypothetical protein
MQYHDLLKLFIDNVVESGNYQKFADVLMDNEYPTEYFSMLHNFFLLVSDYSTKYDPVENPDKLMKLIQITKPY